MIPPLHRLSIFAAVLSLWSTALAQEAITTPAFEPAPRPSEKVGAEITEPMTGEIVPMGAELSSQPRRFAYGIILSTRGVYDDNINISNTNKISDFYLAIEPVLTTGFGDITGQEENYIRLDYAPSALLFVDHSENDALQHFISLSGQHRTGRMTSTLSQQIAVLDGTDIRASGDLTNPGEHVNIDVGGRNRYQTYTTRLNASYDLSGKTFLSGGGDVYVTNYSSAGLISSRIVSGNLFVNYRYSDKVTVGLGGTMGYDSPDDPNPDQTFEQANGRISYQASGKVNFNASGGVEFRQFGGNSRGQYATPVFELSASYQPSDGTSFSLSGHRRTYDSGALAGQDFSETILNASLRRRLLQRFYLGIAVGYQQSDYFSAVKNVTANRNDHYYYVQPTLDFNVTRYWTAGVYYLHRQNDSSFDGFQFADNQVGFRSTLTF